VTGQSDTSDDVLTVDEAARYLRIGRNALYDAIGRGKIPHARIGRTIRLSRRVLARVLGGAA
jgi:excisionase family DNA binding protein